MVRYILISWLVFCTGLPLLAQPLAVSDSQVQLNGVVGEKVGAGVEVRNNSNQSMDLMLKLTGSNLQPKHRLQICWAELCLFDQPPVDPISLSAGGKYQGLKVDLIVAEDAPEGVSTATFSITTVGGQRESAEVTFVFNISKTTSSTVSVHRSGLQMGIAFPNPATDAVRIPVEGLDKTGSAVRLRLHDIMGREVYRQNVTVSGPVVVNVRNFRPGVYFYSLEADGKILASRRLNIATQ
jgi:hypothetical protein